MQRRQRERWAQMTLLPMTGGGGFEIGWFTQQQIDDAGVALLRGEVQWLPAAVHRQMPIGASLEQDFDRRRLTADRGDMQRRELMAGVAVVDRGLFIEQRANE